MYTVNLYLSKPYLIVNLDYRKRFIHFNYNVCFSIINTIPKFFISKGFFHLKFFCLSEPYCPKTHYPKQFVRSG